MAKTLLVTGGSGGIGRAVARLAAAHGYAVALTYGSNPDKAEAVVREVAAAGGRAVAYAVDLGQEEAIVGLFEKVDAELGRLSALVNNAGVIGWEGRVDEARADRLNDLWAVNLTSYFICAREAVRRMSTRHGGEGGAIVNVSSLSGRSGGRDGRVHYAASKGAINTLTVGLAKEVATEGIRVNAVIPAVIATEIHDAFGGEERQRKLAPSMPMKRVGTPEEVAEAVLWLVSDKASFTTGTLLDVTGGA